MSYRYAFGRCVECGHEVKDSSYWRGLGPVPMMLSRVLTSRCAGLSVRIKAISLHPKENNHAPSKV